MAGAVSETRFGAFISYRQAEPDRTIAEALQRLLERYRTPRALVRSGIRPRVERVFLDRSELAASADLGAELLHALEQSQFLLVVCSPRTPESKWVSEEIKTFVALGRRDRILPLLIEGAPAEAFPGALLAEKGKEPLGADIRDLTVRRSLRRLKNTETIRILAPMLGVRYDALWQRERRRRRTRRIATLSAVAAVVALVAIVFSFALKQRGAARREQLARTVTKLIDESAAFADRGSHDMSGLLALQARELDEREALGRSSAVYGAFRRALGGAAFGKLIAVRTGRVVSVAVDERQVVIGHSDGSVEVKAASNLEDEAVTSFEDLSVRAIAMLPGGGFVVGLDDGEVWRCDSRPRGIVRSRLGRCRSVSVNAIAVSPTGGLVAVGTDADGICLLDPAGARPERWISHPHAIRGIAFDPPARWLAVASKAGVTLHAVAGAEVSQRGVTLPLPGETATSVAFTEERLAAGTFEHMATLGTLISGGEQANPEHPKGFVRVWELARLGDLPMRLEADSQRVTGVVFASGGLLVSGGADGVMRAWSLHAIRTPPLLVRGHRAGITSMAVRRDGALLTAGDADGDVHFWKLRPPRDILLHAESQALSLAFLEREGCRLAVAVNAAEEPWIWDIATAVPSRLDVPALKGAVVTVATDPSHPGRLAIGTGLFVSAPYFSTSLWNVGAKSFPSQPLIRHESPVEALALDGRGVFLASAGVHDGALAVQDVRTGTTTSVKLPEDAGGIHALAFAPGDPPALAVGCDHGTILLVDPERPGSTPRRLAPGRPESTTPAVVDLAFSADRGLMVEVRADGAVRLRHGEGWKDEPVMLEAVGDGKAMIARRAAFAPDASLIVGYADGAIRIWNAHDPGRTPLVVDGGSGTPVHSLAIAADGTRFASGYLDGTVHVWPSQGAIVADACAQVGRDLEQCAGIRTTGPTCEAPR